MNETMLFEPRCHCDHVMMFEPDSNCWYCQNKGCRDYHVAYYRPKIPYERAGRIREVTTVSGVHEITELKLSKGEL